RKGRSPENSSGKLTPKRGSTISSPPIASRRGAPATPPLNRVRPTSRARRPASPQLARRRHERTQHPDRKLAVQGSGKIKLHPGRSDAPLDFFRVLRGDIRNQRV